MTRRRAAVATVGILIVILFGWRPDAILRKLLYDGFSIRPERGSTYDHGAGWGVMGTGRAHI